MSLTDRFKRSPDEGTPEGAGAAEARDVPIARYDRLSEKEITSQLTELSQVDLAAVETYERAHENRPVVLDRLRYVRGAEPMPDYDNMTVEQILAALKGADGELLRAVRDYERKFQHRQAISGEIARALPSSEASAGEVEARQAKVDLVKNRPGAPGS